MYATPVVPRSLARLAILLAVFAVALTLVSVPAAMRGAPAEAAARTRAMPASFDSRVIALVNVERTERGLRPLRAGGCIDKFAARQAKAMARKNRMYHQSLGPILRDCGRRGAGENVAWRSPKLTAAKVVRMWMDSPGHRRNILNPKFRVIGVDAVKHARSGRVYAAQVFAR